MENKRLINFRIDRSSYKKLKLLSAEKDISISKLMNIVLKNYTDQYNIRVELTTGD